MSGAVVAWKRLPRSKFCNGWQGCRPHSATGHIANRYRQAPGFPERIIDSQNVFILIASRKDFARQNYKIQASLTRIAWSLSGAQTVGRFFKGLCREGLRAACGCCRRVKFGSPLLGFGRNCPILMKCLDSRDLDDKASWMLNWSRWRVHKDNRIHFSSLAQTVTCIKQRVAQWLLTDTDKILIGRNVKPGFRRDKCLHTDCKIHKKRVAGRQGCNFCSKFGDYCFPKRKGSARK